MVAHACYSSNLGDGDGEELRFEASLGKKFLRPHLNQWKAGCGGMDMSTQLHREHK
jgi:hypothetical protein